MRLSERGVPLHHHQPLPLPESPAQRVLAVAAEVQTVAQRLEGTVHVREHGVRDDVVRPVLHLDPDPGPVVGDVDPRDSLPRVIELLHAVPEPNLAGAAEHRDAADFVREDAGLADGTG